RKDVLSRIQELLNRTGNTPLDHDRLSCLAQSIQQVEILGIPGADLEDINIIHHFVNLRYLHDFRNDLNAGCLCPPMPHLESLSAQSTERIRRTSWLENATTHYSHIVFAQVSDRCCYLFFTFDRARTSHQCQVAVANDHTITEINRGTLNLPLAGYELVRVRYPVYVGHTFHVTQLAYVEFLAANADKI